MALLTIEDRHIKSMLGDQRFADAIPCLGSTRSSLQRAYKGCGTCGRRRQQARMSAYTQVRNCLATLPADQRTKLKNLMKADKIRVVRVVGGKRSPVTF